MSREKREIKDSFPPLAHLDRDELRDTFVSLRNGPSKQSNPSSGSAAERGNNPPKRGGNPGNGASGETLSGKSHNSNGRAA